MRDSSEVLKDNGFKSYQINKSNCDLLKEHFFYNTDIKLEDIYDHEFEKIESHKAIRRVDDDSLINIVSSKYQITQHKDMVLPFIQSFVENDDYDITLIIENVGNRNRAMCTITSKETDEINGEEYKRTILIANASDGSMSRKILAGLFRMACLNMQFSGVPITQGDSIHRGKTKDSDSYKQDFQNIAIFIEQEIDNMVTLIKRLHNIPFKENEAKFAINLYKSGLVPKKLMVNPLVYLTDKDIYIPSQDIYRLKDPKTLFDIYQRVTLWSTHITNNDNITRGVNINKKIYKEFKSYVSNLMD